MGGWKVKRISKIRIPLEDINEELKERLHDLNGKIQVIIVDEPCLTCGHKKRIQYVNRTDGKREIIQQCLFCICSVHTKTNREGP